jgi:hypothetical protein
MGLAMDVCMKTIYLVGQKCVTEGWGSGFDLQRVEA